MNKQFVKTFILGTTILISIFPFVYLGRSHIKYGPLQGIHFEDIIIFLPIFFGLVNVLMVHYMPKITKYPANSVQNTFITGALAGLLMSFIGRYKYNIPQQLFKGMENQNMVHVYAFILYGLVFSIVARNMNILFKDCV